MRVISQDTPTWDQRTAHHQMVGVLRQPTGTQPAKQLLLLMRRQTASDLSPAWSAMLSVPLPALLLHSWLCTTGMSS
jgi:hypothetical protein